MSIAIQNQIEELRGIVASTAELLATEARLRKEIGETVDKLQAAVVEVQHRMREFTKAGAQDTLEDQLAIVQDLKSNVHGLKSKVGKLEARINGHA